MIGAANAAISILFNETYLMLHFSQTEEEQRVLQISILFNETYLMLHNQSRFEFLGVDIQFQFSLMRLT